jgi:hypothetical protein
MKIFISYSRKDKKYKDKLIKSILKLEEDNLAKIFLDERKIKLGDGIDDVILKELLSSDIFILLISGNFWDSEYIRNHEYPFIQKRYKEDNCRIIPIVLKDTKDLLEHAGIKKKLAIPQGKAVVNFRPQSKVFNEVYYELKKIITSKNIIDNLPILQLLRKSLQILSPYDSFEELSIENIKQNDDKTYDIKYIKYYKNDSSIIFNEKINLSDNEKNILKEIFESIYFNPKAHLVKLKDELLEHEVITKSKLFNILNISDNKQLFPASSKIKQIDKFIYTKDIKNLRNSLDGSLSRKLLVYGEAGIGKTSTLSSLNRKYEENMIIVYDCFGAGTYKNIGSKRHSKKTILIQLLNEIAILTGLSIYVDKNISLNDLEFEFMFQLNNTSKLLCEKNLYIIIDAADNSVDAANEFNSKDEKAFVTEIWNIDLPKNCYLIMSARPGLRKDSLEAIKEVETLELKGFDEESSKKLLKEYFPNVSDDIILKFYNKTSGIPRLQSYLLDEVSGKYDKLISILENEQKFSLSDIFENIWNDAINIIQPITRNHVEELIVLARPSSIDDFILASRITKKETLKIIETFSGIKINSDNSIGFLDEDFELFLNDKLSNDDKLEAHKRISQNLLPCITQNKFATKFIAYHLEQSKDYQTLIDISLENDLSNIEDRLERNEILKDRIERSLKVCVENKYYVETFKLLFLATEVIKSDALLKDFLDSNPDLLSFYTSSQSALNYSLNTNKNNSGAFYYHCAYMIVKEDTEKAEELLGLGDNWLDEYLEKDDPYSHDLKAIDIAKRIATIYYVYGIEEVCISSHNWSLGFLIQVIDNLPNEFLKEFIPSIQDELYTKLRRYIHPFVQALLLVKLYRVGNQPSKDLIEKEIVDLTYFINKNPKEHKELYQSIRHDERADINKISIDFTQMALCLEIEPKSLVPIFRLTKLENFQSFHDTMYIKGFKDTFYALSLNAKILGKELNIEKYLKVRDKDKPKYTQESQKESQKKLIELILPYHLLLAKVVVEKLSFNDIKDEWSNLSSNIGVWDYYRREIDIISARLIILIEILVYSKGESESFVKILDSINEKLSFYYGIYDISKILLENGYLDEAYELIKYQLEKEQNEPAPSHDKIEIFSKYALLLKDFNIDLSRYCIELAIDATSGLDDNVYYLYKIISSYTEYTLPILSQNQKVELANKNINIVETIKEYLYKGKNALLEEMIEMASNIDTSLALQLAQKWDNCITYRFDNSMSIIIDNFAKNNALPLNQLFSLRYFVKDENIGGNFISILNMVKHDKQSVLNILEDIEEFIRKNLKQQEQYNCIEKIVKWLENYSLSEHKVTIKLKEFISFYKSLKIQNESLFIQGLEDNDSQNNLENWDEYFKSYEKNITSSLKDFEYFRADRKEYFNEVRKRISNDENILWVKEICDLDKEFCSKYMYDEFLYCMDKWKHNSNIKSQKRELIERFVKVHYEMFLISYDCHNCYEKLYKFISKEELFHLILVAVSKKPFLKYMNNTLHLLNISKELVDKKGAKDVLDYVISELEKKVDIKNDILKIEDTNSTQALIKNLYKLMGNQDKRIRWKALHSSKEMIKKDNTLILIFLEQFDNNDGFPFTDDKSFYPISAKWFMLILFYRLSFELVDELKNHIQDFLKIVFEEKFPHVVIQHIAKKVVLNIVEKYPDSITKEEKEKLKFINEPKSCIINKKKSYRIGRNNNLEKRFRFDETDTIAYWFDKITSTFNITMQEVIVKAEEWIIDRWGQCDSEIRIEKINYWEHDDRYLTSHRHGSLPTIEIPIRHIEFQVMFLVVGELLKSEEIFSNHYFDEEKSWYECKYQSFINKYFNSDEYWDYEKRDTKSMDRLLWGKFDKENISFDELFEIKENKVLLKAEYSVYTQNSSMSIKIDSALVSSEYSKSLQNAIQNMDPLNYYLPVFGAEYDEIDKHGMLLKGVFIEVNKYDKEIKDSYVHRFNSNNDLPNDEFCSFCKEENIKIENWSDEDQEDRIIEPQSSGYKIYIDKDAVVKYLQSKNMDMIIDIRCDIDNEKHAIYILTQNAEILKYKKDESVSLAEKLVEENYEYHERTIYNRWLIHEKVKQ